MCNPFLYEFRVAASVNIFKFVCYIAKLLRLTLVGVLLSLAGGGGGGVEGQAEAAELQAIVHFS
jgi:hypothetical protein